MSDKLSESLEQMEQFFMSYSGANASDLEALAGQDALCAVRALKRVLAILVPGTPI